MPAPKVKVVVTRKLPAEIETRMCELFDVELNHDDAPMSAERLIDAVSRAAAPQKAPRPAGHEIAVR